MSIGVGGVIHLIGQIFKFQWIPSISGFYSGSRPHFRSEWIKRFMYFNKIQHFVHLEGDCQCPLELVV